VDVEGIVEVDVVDVEGIVDVLGTVLVVMVGMVVVDVVGAVSVVVGGVSVVIVGTVVSPAAACGPDSERAEPADEAAMADVDANPKMIRPKATAIVAANRFMNKSSPEPRNGREPFCDECSRPHRYSPPTRQEYRDPGSDTQVIQVSAQVYSAYLCDYNA
jgi:hypothetical protein